MSDPATVDKERKSENLERTARITPAMKQFYEAKKEYPDCVIFFRMGDFYETFCEDAEICSRELNITLTSRGRMPDGHEIPLAGVPHHALETYLSRMISKGYKVAICEQIEDPKKAKGIVRRAVVRVVTPGTIMDAALLASESGSYLMAVCPDKKGKILGVSFIDISTGDFLFSEIPMRELYDSLRSDIARYNPAECIIPFDTEETLKNALMRWVPLVSPQDPGLFSLENAKSVLCRQLQISSPEDLPCYNVKTATSAAGAALGYAQKTQFDSLSHIRTLKSSDSSSHLVLDAVTLRNLEITQNIRNRTEEGTLTSAIDLTISPMGRRLLRKRLTAPIVDKTDIEKRLDAVSFFIGQNTLRQKIRTEIREISDLERIAGRVSYKNASPKDVVLLGAAIESSEIIKNSITGINPLPDLVTFAVNSIKDLSSIGDLIRKAIVDEPPLLKKGGVIREGYNPELDRLKSLSTNGKQWIADFESREKERTGIRSLKIKYNAVFGYYIEITKANLSLVPPDYERKQTTVNGERYTIPELKEMEAQILTAEERLLSLEEELFNEIISVISREIPTLQEIAGAVSEIDLYSALAEIALKNRYVRPDISNKQDILIRQGRHPVVELTLKEGFVPNDAEMSGSSEQILIITGANMAGKSTYMRSVALIVIMAQMGSFVPADYARIGIADRIFTRVGAFDDLASGQSTFMVEMTELATILNHATEKSLVILDEIGRGTSTLDGYCIAKAALEYLHGKKSNGPRCLFATHFHEIVGIEASLKRVRNCHFAVKENSNEVTFLRKLVPGATNRSFGIHVARLAGVPSSVVQRSEEIMKQVINGEEQPGGGVKRYTQMILLDSGDMRDNAGSELTREIADIDVDSITPLKALEILADLKRRVES